MRRASALRITRRWLATQEEPNLERIAVDQRVAVPAIKLNPNVVYYHGTSTARSGEAIRRSGIEPTDLATSGTGAFRSVRGRVYLTPHLSYAMLYALGGEVAETFLRGAKDRAYHERLWRGEDWGYLFVIPGKEINELHPDKDSVGEMVATETGPAWLKSLAQNLLSNVRPELRPNAPDTFYVPDFFSNAEWREMSQRSLLDLLDDGFFQLKAQAVAGKILLNAMTPAQELDLITMGAHVAHEGKVFPTQCWKILKSNAPLLKRDGSNFFQVAQRC